MLLNALLNGEVSRSPTPARSPKGKGGCPLNWENYIVSNIDRYSSTLIPKVRRLLRIIKTGISASAGMTKGRMSPSLW